MSRPLRSPMQWPAYPDIPIHLEAADERSTAKTYGTTPTTPTTPEIAPGNLHHGSSTHLRPAHVNIPQPSPIDPSPTTTIQTSSDRSIIWPIPEPPPEIQPQQHSRRPALRFFPTERPRVRLDGVPSLQIPQINEKTPINNTHPGLGIINGLPKPPSIEISPPEKEQSDLPNIAQRIEETLWRYSASGNILKRWLLEVLSWLFSALCMAAVIGVLIKLRDEPLSKWALAEKTGFTLNAYISILSKMAGAALILPVSEALGQLKWSWFLEHSKQMWDFEIFDNASRGPWGSLLLLVRTKGRALAALGAMIMLCSLLLDPFFQQVVDFPDRPVLQNTNSTIPRVVDYEPGFVPAFKQGFEITSEDRALAAVAREFFYDNGTQPVTFGNGTRPDIPLSCPTSNCTWPPYETLAVCSSCVDVFSDLNITYGCLDTTIEWSANWTGPLSDVPYPNGTVCGYFLNRTSEAPILMSGYVNDPDAESGFGEALVVRAVPLTDFDTKLPLYGAGSIRFKNVRNPILDALIVSAVDGSESVYQKKAPIVHECILSWCVQTIKSSYDWGKYSENVTSKYLNTAPGPITWPWETFEVDTGTFLIYAQNVTLEPPASSANRSEDTVFNNRYHLSNITVANTMNFFDDFFPSFYTAMDPTAKPRLRYRNYPDTPPTSQELKFNPWQAPKNISHHMERLAMAMTNVMRSSPSKIMINGTAYNRENFVSVRWEWLTLPLGLLCISFIFLAATVAKSAVERDRVGVWKTSAYATLLYGLPDEMQQKLTRSASTGTPRSKAKELKVKLQPNHGWRVSGNLFSPFTPKPRVNQPPPGWI
ncbi:Nn.00g044060.m01.CDS01 [Neocucurbitaria sp. VM-36]